MRRHKPRSNAELEFDRQLGAALMRARQARGVSGPTLAGALNVTHQHVYSIESGGRCSCFLLVKIAGALKVDLSRLVADAITHCILKKPSTRAAKVC